MGSTRLLPCMYKPAKTLWSSLLFHLLDAMCSVLVNSDNVLYFVLCPCTGTGKTTVLRHLVELNPNWKFLYCVYNKLVDKPFTSNCYSMSTLLYQCSVRYVDQSRYSWWHIFTSIPANISTTALIHPCQVFFCNCLDKLCIYFQFYKSSMFCF